MVQMCTIYMVLTMTRPVENQSGTLIFVSWSIWSALLIWFIMLPLFKKNFPVQLFMHMSVCAPCVYKCTGRPEDHLKLELQMVVSSHVGPSTASAFNCRATSTAPALFPLITTKHTSSGGWPSSWWTCYFLKWATCRLLVWVCLSAPPVS